MLFASVTSKAYPLGRVYFILLAAQFMHITAFIIVMYSPDGHRPSEGHYVSDIANMGWVVATLLPCVTTVIVTGLTGELFL
jgi:hypothetical protein